MRRMWMGSFGHWAAKPSQLWGSWTLGAGLLFRIFVLKSHRIHLYGIFILDIVYGKCLNMPYMDPMGKTTPRMANRSAN